MEPVVAVVAALALQIGFDVSMARSIGPNWSAKYSLPLTVGIPLVLAFAAGVYVNVPFAAIDGWTENNALLVLFTT